MKRITLGLLFCAFLSVSCSPLDQVSALLVEGREETEDYIIEYDELVKSSGLITQVFSITRIDLDEIDEFRYAHITYDTSLGRTTIDPIKIWINNIQEESLTNIEFSTEDIFLKVVYDLSDYDIDFDVTSEIAIGNQTTILTIIPK